MMQNLLMQMGLDARISGIITRSIDLPFRFYMLIDPSTADFRQPAFLPLWHSGSNEIFGIWVAKISPISIVYARSVREEGTIELLGTSADQFIAWIAVYAVDIGESSEPLVKFLAACSAQVGFDEVQSVSCGDRDFSRLFPFRDGTLNPEHPPLLNEPCENARELFYAAVREHDAETAWKLLNVSGWWEIDELKLAFDAFRNEFQNLKYIEHIYGTWIASMDAMNNL